MKAALPTGAVLLVGVLLVGLVGHPSAPPGPSGPSAPSARPAPAAERSAVPPAPPAVTGAGPSAAWARADSLQGSDWDGDWALASPQGLPQPSRRLRDRFDHLLSQLGERELPAIRAQLLARLEADALPAATRAELLRLYDAYLAVQQHPYRFVAEPQAPHTWRAALAERQLVRRQHLGADWAAAFWGEDDRALMASLSALRGDRPAALPDVEPPRHPQAAAREAALEAEWRDWERRLDAARTHWQALARDASRSAPQREQAWQQHLDGHFDAAEQRRVRALVERPPPSPFSAGSP